MIVVVGRVQTDAERRTELIAIGQRVAAASRAEPGCLNYHLCQDTEGENAFVFVEEWEDQEALERHFASPHIARFMADIPALLTGPPDVRFHTIAGTADLASVGRR